MPGVLLAALLGHGPVYARDFSVSPTDYRQFLKQLQAGDRLLLKPGVYFQGLAIQDLSGSTARPIVIEGPPDGAAVLVAQPNSNTISIVDSSHVHIRNLHLEGRGLPVDAVKAEGHARWAHHITLENLTILGYGHDQQTVAISTKCPAWGWIIRHNVIVGAGTGMYFGNSDGRAPFIDGLIEHNLIRDTLGYNLQIKHQRPRPVLSGMPHEKSATIIRHNVFSKARGGSEQVARPNVLVGHWPLKGVGQDDHYFIYGNFFYQNPHESLFQGEGNIALYNNLFVNHAGDAIRIQPHRDTPRVIDIFFNTVIAVGTGIHLAHREGDRAYPQSIVGNAVFAAKPFSNVSVRDNFTAGYDAAKRYLMQPFAPPGEMDLRPQPGAFQRVIPERMVSRTFPDWDLDFNGVRRNMAEAGAYASDADSRHWTPGLTRKLWP